MQAGHFLGSWGGPSSSGRYAGELPDLAIEVSRGCSGKPSGRGRLADQDAILFGRHTIIVGHYHYAALLNHANLTLEADRPG